MQKVYSYLLSIWLVLLAWVVFMVNKVDMPATLMEVYVSHNDKRVPDQRKRCPQKWIISLWVHFSRTGNIHTINCKSVLIHSFHISLLSVFPARHTGNTEPHGFTSTESWYGDKCARLVTRHALLSLPSFQMSLDLLRHKQEQLQMAPKSQVLVIA